MDTIHCPFCNGIANMEYQEITVRNGLKKVHVDTIIYRCIDCGRTTQLPKDRLNAASELHKGEKRVYTDARTHRTRKKNADKIPNDFL